ncbi:MAG: extracellular matrix regulator RemB [Christensenellales bacterium]
MLHLGADIMISLRDIIAILDADALKSKDTAAFFMAFSKNAVRLGGGEYKSCVITETKGKQTIYLSPISSMSLGRRAVQKRA